MTSSMILGPDEKTPEEKISPDTCFDILSNHRRRYTLYYLRQNGGEVSLAELARGIAAWENDSSPEDVTYNERKRVYTSLQQVHLPRMNEMDIVEFDDQAKIIKTGPAASELDIHLELVKNDRNSWGIFYFGLALLNLAAISVVSVGGSIAGFNGGIELAVLCVATFLLTSLLHLYDTR
jgi:hypothetical protein